MGIDPSLTSTGWAVRDESGFVKTGHIDTGKLKGPWRLHYAETELKKLLDKFQPETVAYEDYAMGSGPNKGRVFDIGELGGVYKKLLWLAGIDCILVSPTAMKKFVTGKGNPGFTPKGEVKLTAKAKKELIRAALLKDFHLSINQNDEADAAGLLLMAEVYAGTRSIPNTHLKSVRAGAVSSVSVVRGKLQLISKR